MRGFALVANNRSTKVVHPGVDPLDLIPTGTHLVELGFGTALPPLPSAFTLRDGVLDTAPFQVTPQANGIKGSIHRQSKDARFGPPSTLAWYANESEHVASKLRFVGIGCLEQKSYSQALRLTHNR